MLRQMRFFGQLMVASTVVCLAGLAPLTLQAADDQDDVPNATTSEKTLPDAPPKKITGRLPPHYGKVVTPEQRIKIYEIQAEFKPRIDAARDALDALLRQRNGQIAAVLTPEQKKQLEDAAANSKRKRKELAEDTAPKTTSATPANLR